MYSIYLFSIYNLGCIFINNNNNNNLFIRESWQRVVDYNIIFVRVSMENVHIGTHM